MSTQETLFSFEGRIKRSTYWGYVLLLVPIWVGGVLIDLAATGQPGVFYAIGVIICFWPGLALSIKRCHDRNRSGWFCLISLIPIISIWYLIEIGFLRGTEGDNRFGSDPLSESA
jgi:uncharacterized membrane protein YhaH (DUF805 family)